MCLRAQAEKTLQYGHNFPGCTSEPLRNIFILGFVCIPVLPHNKPLNVKEGWELVSLCFQ